MDRWRCPSLLLVALCLAACSSNGAGQNEALPEAKHADQNPARRFITKYDINGDGSLTREELIKGLKEDFKAADLNRDGRLDPDEVRAVNIERWNSELSMSSPLVDWNNDGFVDFREFSVAPLSTFEQFDSDEDGVVTPAEFHPHRPRPRPE